MCDLYYEKHGHGDLQILMIHGWASSRRMWHSVIENIGELATFWLIDLPNFGESAECSPAPVTIAQQTQAVKAFLIKHELHPDIIVAHSMGTIISVQLIAALDKKPERVLLIAPVVSGSLGAGGSTGRILRSRLTGALEPIWIAIAAAFLRQPFLPLLFIGTPYSKSQKQDFIQDYADMNKRAALDLLNSIAKTKVDSLLTELQMPVLICSGAEDKTVPISESQRAADLLPNTRLILFPDADHHPYLEYPVAFASLFQSFLTSGLDNLDDFKADSPEMRSNLVQ